MLSRIFPYPVSVCKLGTISFKDALSVQKKLCEAVASAKSEYKDTLLLLEHFPVYTIGIRTKDYTADDQKRLKSLGADFVKTNRGGLITFHGPGQLVAYPILYLGNFNNKRSMKWYISQLEKLGIGVCENLGLKAQTSVHTGVWVEDRKIAAIGVHGSRYVTSHGIALNCNVDLSWFDHIVPCGIPDKDVTSLSRELQCNVTVEDVTPLFLRTFADVFQCGLQEQLT